MTIPILCTGTLTLFVSTVLLSAVVPSYAQRSIDITKAPYNAVADGVMDNTDAINHALSDASAATPKKSVHIPSGAFAHKSILINNGVLLYGDGNKSMLIATDPGQGAIQLMQQGPQLKNLRITSPNAVKRLQTSASAAVEVHGASDFVVDHVTIGASGVTGASSAGIICIGAPSTNGRMTNNTVTNTLADGIHMTHGTNHITIENNTIENTGDDMIAVVSYVKDGMKAHDITIRNNHAISQTHGRAITVVGGDNVTIEGNTIDSSSAAAIYVCAESSYHTYGVDNIQILNNTIENANQTHDVVQGAVLIYGRQDGQTIFSASHIVFSGNSIKDTFYTGIRVGAYTNNVTITNNRIDGTTAEGIAINHTAEKSESSGARDITVSGNTIQNTGTSAIRVLPMTQGTITITKNTLLDINTSNRENIDVISVDRNITVKPLVITGNRYQNPGNDKVRDFINVAVSAAASGTSATVIQATNTTKASAPIVVVP